LYAVDNPLIIAEDTPAEWGKYGGAGLDFVADPMVLRTGELFLGGRSGTTAIAADPENIWAAINNNLGALFTFFDTLVTRERMPYLQYWETYYVMPTTDLVSSLGTLLVPVSIEYGLYQHVLEEVKRALQDVSLETLPDDLVNDVAGELGAFAYEWHPPLPLEWTVLDEHRRRVAEFLTGGMVFGAYAQATGSDHVIQSKRSRLLLEMSPAGGREGMWGWHEEDRLFSGFRQYCAGMNNVRAGEFPSGPTVLPHLLLQEPAPVSTRDLLERCLKLREDRDGVKYRSWLKGLREAWRLGREETPEARETVEETLRELNARLATPGIRPHETRVTVEGPTADLEVGMVGPVPEVKLTIKDIPINRPPTPRWLAAWTFEHLSFKRHRRLLLRLALNQTRYRDISRHLYAVWSRS